MKFKEKISKASNVRKVDPIYIELCERLAKIDEIHYIKIYNGRVKASNTLSTNGKKIPITENGLDDTVGVELLIDISTKVIQFFSITSSIKGCGEKIVRAVLEGASENWGIYVVWDSSGGFWARMNEKYPRVKIF